MASRLGFEHSAQVAYQDAPFALLDLRLGRVHPCNNMARELTQPPAALSESP